MKKNTYFVMLLALILSLSMLLSGCSQPQNSETPSEDNAGVSEPDTGIEAPPAEPDESPISSAEPLETVLPDDETNSTETASDEENPAPEGNTPNSPTDEPVPEPVPAPTPAPEPVPVPEPVPEPEAEQTASSYTLSGTDLSVRFGGGETFALHLYDNDTADKIAEYVGTAAWQLPIYHYDDYDGWESFQYYDIPSRYDIPSLAESVTSERAGAVYYSHPNRIILFYQDANISSEYTPVGYIDFSQELVDAVENNPVVEGWGNKLVFIQS